MKNKIHKTLVILSFLSVNAYSQPWFTNGNPAIGPSDFLGSTNNAPVFFRTNNFPRVMIDGGAGTGPASQTGGQVAISNNLPSGFTPQARLHIHHNLFNPTGSVAPFIRFTTSATGPTNTDGFTIGNSTSFATTNNGIVNLNRHKQGPIIIPLLS